MRGKLRVPQKVISNCFKSSTQLTGTGSRGSCRHPPASSRTPFPFAKCTPATGLLSVQQTNQALFRLRTRLSPQPCPSSCLDFLSVSSPGSPLLIRRPGDFQSRLSLCPQHTALHLLVYVVSEPHSLQLNS